MRRTIPFCIGLAVGILGSVCTSIASPDYDPLAGQSFGHAPAAHRMGLWRLAWKPADAEGPTSLLDMGHAARATAWYFSFGARPSFLFEGHTFSGPTDHGAMTSYHVMTRSESALSQLGIEGDTACGVASSTVTIRAEPRTLSVDASQRGQPDSVVTPYPICGARMIEMVEERDGVRYQTCVDRAYPVAESASQLTLIFSDDRLEWALSPMPFHPDMEDGTEPKAVEGPWWPVPEGCHPLFAPRAADALPAPRRNAAFAMTWGAPNALSSLQIWQDDHETGSFFLFYDDGRLMTQGYRDDGLQHGLWWYFAHDGTLLEARLYALGVELERLPVKTVRKREPPL